MMILEFVNNAYAVVFITTLYVVEVALRLEQYYKDNCPACPNCSPNQPQDLSAEMREEDPLSGYTPPSYTFANDILTNDLIYDLIVDRCAPDALVNLSRTCRNAHSAVQSFISRFFNINKHLTRYFSDPIAFRCLQARTGTLISGSSALQFLERVCWDESDLDIYTYYDSREEVGNWILQQGYRFQPNSRQSADFTDAVNEAHIPDETVESPYRRMKGVSAVYTFLKSDEGQPTRQLKVQIIVALRCPMDVILNFHSSLVMNVISWDRAYCLYPRATFVHRTSLIFKKEMMHETAVLDKYTGRGYSFITKIPVQPTLPQCQHCTHCTEGYQTQKSLAAAFPSDQRWIADSHSWVIRLSTDGVTQSATSSADLVLSQDPCYVTTWQMIEKRRGYWRGPRTKFTVYKAISGFRYQYVAVNSNVKKAMTLLHSLYIGLPGFTDDSPANCDEELIRFFRTMLERGGVWELWRFIAAIPSPGVEQPASP